MYAAGGVLYVPRSCTGEQMTELEGLFIGHRDSVIPSFWSGRGSDKTASDHSETMIDKGSGLSVGIISNLLQMLTKKCNENLSKISLLKKKTPLKHY